MSDEELVKHCMCGCMYLEAECPNCNKVTDADRIEELEAKLAKAVEALERAKASIESGGGGGVTDVVWLDDPCPETLCDFIDATLAEIEGSDAP